MKSLFVTDSEIQESGTGGGTVCWHIRKALVESTSNLTLDKRSLGQFSSPFLLDYFAEAQLNSAEIDLAVSYGAPFGLVMHRVKEQMGQTIVDIAPHNVEVSREEHQRLGYGWNAPHLDNEYLWKIYTRHIREADVVVVHSRMGGEYLKKKCGIESYVVIPHGCDLPNDYHLYPEQFTVGHVGVNGADKGQVYLYKAVAGMAAYLIAGSGTELWQGGLGYVENADSVYENCSVYVQPSVTEGFGIPVVEAMAHWRPVIVAEGAGASELVQDGVNGFVVPIRDIQAIKDKIRYFIDNPSEVIRMGLNARGVAEMLSWDIIEGEYKELWIK